MARIQAAVDSAHAVQDPARRDAKGNDAEPLPRQRTADRRGDAGRRLDAEALDDLAESYLAADPDLTAGYIEGATADDAISDESTGSGGDVLGSAERPGQRTAGRRHGSVTVTAAAVVVVAVAVVAIAASSRPKVIESNAGRTHKNTVRVAELIRQANDRTQTAIWVAGHVSHHVVVACDPVMCQALVESGFGVRRLYTVGRTSSYPVRSAVVVVTPALWRHFGASFGTDWAPTVLAGFGQGTDRITIRVMAPQGTRAYQAALSADAKQRKLVGTSLAASSQVAIARVARRALTEGLIDPRLLVVITALAAQHPIDILAFGKNYSGTTAGTPFRMALFAETVPAAGLPSPYYVKSMVDLLWAQLPLYRPMRITTVALPGGGRALEVQFPAPSPLGLLGPHQ